MTITALATGLLPTLGVGGLFFFVMRGIIRADRKEREAIALMDRDEAARLAASDGGRAPKVQ